MTRHKPKPARTRAAPQGVPWGTWYWAKNLINDLGDCGGSAEGVPVPKPGTALPSAGVLSTPVVYVHDQVVYLVGGCENTTDSSIHWYQRMALAAHRPGRTNMLAHGRRERTCSPPESPLPRRRGGQTRLRHQGVKHARE